MKNLRISFLATLLASNLFAVDDIRFGGDLNLFYHTAQTEKKQFFKKNAGAVDASLNLDAEATLLRSDLLRVDTKAAYTFISALGMQNGSDDGVWAGAHTRGGSQSSVTDAYFFTEAFIDMQIKNSSLKIGRMELDTPLLFSEKWSIEKNTFEALQATNEDIADTTFTLAYILSGNGTQDYTKDASSALGMGAVVNAKGSFERFGAEGAYLFGLQNNSVEALKLQAWYYDITHLFRTYWLQADLNIDGFLLGAQYSGIELGSRSAQDGLSSNVYACMIGYEIKDTFDIKFAYSEVDDSYAAGFNTATNQSAAQSKLYTEDWWMYGNVTQAGTKALNVTLDANVADLFTLGFFTTLSDHRRFGSDLRESTLTLSKSFASLHTALAYINVDDSGGDNDEYLQLYMRLDF